MRRFAYMVVTEKCLPHPATQDWLNKLGEQGWELVSVSEARQYSWATARDYFFKRAEQPLEPGGVR
jgi:hypothetical protein